MTGITAETNQVMWLPMMNFVKFLPGADFLVESVVWADDVAIPVATFGARDLAPTIEASLSQVHAIFQAERVSTCRKAKPVVVATFKGPGAPAMHAKYQLESRPGFSVQLVQEEASVHLMPCY